MGRRFRRSLFGYSPREVDEYVSRIAGDFSVKCSEYENEIRKMNERASELRLLLEQLESREKAVGDALVRAEIQARSVIQEANWKSDSIIRAAVAEVAKKHLQVSSLRATVAGFKVDFERLLDQYKASAASIDSQETRLANLGVVCDRQESEPG
jgi:DivIVA domain-containing protein